MITFDLSTITIPTPAAFDVDNPTKNTENLAYVALQILTLMKSNSSTFAGSGEIASAIMDFSSSVLTIAEMDRESEI